jgi:hypothetical protein
MIETIIILFIVACLGGMATIFIPEWNRQSAKRPVEKKGHHYAPAAIDPRDGTIIMVRVPKGGLNVKS